MPEIDKFPVNHVDLSRQTRSLLYSNLQLQSTVGFIPMSNCQAH